MAAVLVAGVALGYGLGLRSASHGTLGERALARFQKQETACLVSLDRLSTKAESHVKELGLDDRLRYRDYLGDPGPADRRGARGPWLSIPATAISGGRLLDALREKERAPGGAAGLPSRGTSGGSKLTTMDFNLEEKVMKRRFAGLLLVLALAGQALAIDLGVKTKTLTQSLPAEAGKVLTIDETRADVRIVAGRRQDPGGQGRHRDSSPQRRGGGGLPGALRTDPGRLPQGVSPGAGHAPVSRGRCRFSQRRHAQALPTMGIPSPSVCLWKSACRAKIGADSRQTSTGTWRSRGSPANWRLRTSRARCGSAAAAERWTCVTATRAVSVKDFAGPVTIRNSSGEVTLARITGDVEVESSYKPVSIETVKGRLLVESQSADVTAREIEGRVDITTSYKAVRVEGVRGDLNLKASSCTGGCGRA